MSEHTTSADIHLAFNSDVMSSIQASVTLKKPLMLYIEDALTGDTTTESSSVQNEWINKILFDNPQLSDYSKRLLADEFIRLQIVKNSQDYHNLVSIMPSFKGAVTPCLFFIFSGQVIGSIPNETDIASIDEKIKTIHQNLQNISGRIQSQQSIPSNPPSATYQQPEASPEITSDERTPETVPTPSKKHATDRPKHDKKSLKEESAEVAATIYRENLLKQQRQAKLDRERILHLLELDRQEQKNREKEKEIYETDESIHENIHNAKLQNSTTYTIQLKLFDGSTTRHQFKSDDKLSQVRDFVLETYPDYNSFPFYFFKNIDRITFGDADENKSLMSLNLNMSTLILKPVEPEESSNISSTTDEHSSSTFSWLRNKMYSYLWSPSSTLNDKKLDSEPLPPRSASPHNADSSASYSSSVQAHSQLEDESDTDTIYHTPLLSATTPSTASLRPTMSNFNIYGSQGLIQQPSSLHSSTHDLHTSPLHQTTDQQSTRIPEQQQVQSVPLEQSADNTDVEDADVNVNNGNSISLQFPDDD